MAMLWLLANASAVHGQVVDDVDADYTDRPIAEIRITGLNRVDEQLVRNQLRAAPGEPYDPQVVQSDLQRLHRLGQFKFIDAQATLLDDGTVLVTYELEEAPIIAEIQVVGNKALSDQDLLSATRIVRGSPRDDFLIEQAKRSIETMYRERGYYLTTVAIDESQLEDNGILFFRVIEGPRVKVKSIQFDGNRAFSDDQLHAEVETRTAIPVFRRGELDEDKLLDDVAALVNFYTSRGYIDVRVDRTIDLSPDQTEVKVTFFIEEGRRYTLRAVRTDPDPLRVFSLQQLEAMLEIRPGDVYSRNKITASIEKVRAMYGVLGYLDVAVRPAELRSSEAPEVDLLLTISEGAKYRVRNIDITGNFLTKDRVIRRHLRNLRPGRPLDELEIDRVRERLQATRLFSDINITILDPDPQDPGYRDILLEVKESNTGSVNFGVAAGSDTGFFGEFSVAQRNFDITDTPESVGELFSGRAFRGGGQRFNMTLRPGNEIFQYIISWSDPAFLDSPYALSVSGQFRSREFRSQGRRLYDERRIVAPIGIGRRLGELWDMGLALRYEHVKLSNIEPTAPVDYFEAAGPDNLFAVGISFTRSTILTFRRPDKGTRLEFSLDQYGGDWTFTRGNVDYTIFITTHRDFLGRAQILKLNARVGYIFGGDAPVYERFYLGGRSFRGFEFRTISPKGLDVMGNQTTDPVGGDWLLFLGAQYEIPLLQEAFTMVGFLDTGTVTNDPGIEDYRVAAGLGFRLYLDAFGQVPIALDFAWPIQSQPGDETEVFSFSAELPF